jgi:hypothetical protein
MKGDKATYMPERQQCLNMLFMFLKLRRYDMAEKQ